LILDDENGAAVSRITAHQEAIPEGVTVGIGMRPKTVAAFLEAMNKAIEFHAMHPVVDRVFGFSELQEALNYLREARHFGKVCLRA
jgi:NADPH:quinone reductase-like Zn-dependent oxidoreductase